MTRPLISVLIPVYNGADYLRQNLDSVLNSTLRELEVVCVDDLSTDSSLQILQEYAAKDPRVKIIRRTDKGGTAVRGLKYGLPYCTGEYFFYISQDDFIDRNCLQALYDKAKATSAQAVVPNLVLYNQQQGADSPVIRPPQGDYNQTLSGREAFVLSLENWQVHGQFLRETERVKKLGFDDTLFTGCEKASRLYLAASDKVVFANVNFYYRRDNPNTIQAKFKPFFIEDLFVYAQLMHFMSEQKYSRRDCAKCLRAGLYMARLYKDMFKKQWGFMTEKDRALTLRHFARARKLFLAYALRHGHWKRVPRIIKTFHLTV